MKSDHRPWPAPGGDPPGWSEQFCTGEGCGGGRWLVRPDPRAPQLWQVAEGEEMAPWTVAAAEPICPRCGELLAAHREGVGEPDGAVNNPFVAYIRALKQAA